MVANDDEKNHGLSEVGKSQWGKETEGHFGYASDEERMAKRGLEDWELVEKISESQKGVPSFSPWLNANSRCLRPKGQGLLTPTEY